MDLDKLCQGKSKRLRFYIWMRLIGGYLNSHFLIVSILGSCFCSLGWRWSDERLFSVVETEVRLARSAVNRKVVSPQWWKLTRSYKEHLKNCLIIFFVDSESFGSFCMPFPLFSWSSKIRKSTSISMNTCSWQVFCFPDRFVNSILLLGH